MHSRRGSAPLWARVDLNQLLRVVEGGCRFGEIDAVLRNVRFFFLGIPFKSHPLDTGTIWDNINIKLQYNFAGNSATLLGIQIVHKSTPHRI